MALGPTEIIFIFLAILLLFGAKRIPEIARGLGKGIREFKDATNDIKQELTVHDRPQVQAPRYQAPAAQEQPSQPVATETTPPLPASPPPAEGQAPTP